MFRQKLGDINVSFISSAMKSSPEIKFIKLVLLFVTIFKVAKDSYHPLLALASMLAPFERRTFTSSVDPSLAAKIKGEL